MSDIVCAICDGGPGNECACNCGMKKWSVGGITLEKTTAISWMFGEWIIDYDPPPIPLRNCDYQFRHKDYDEGDSRHGSARSLLESIDLIVELGEDE